MSYVHTLDGYWRRTASSNDFPVLGDHIGMINVAVRTKYGQCFLSSFLIPISYVPPMKNLALDYAMHSCPDSRISYLPGTFRHDEHHGYKKKHESITLLAQRL